MIAKALATPKYHLFKSGPLAIFVCSEGGFSGGVVGETSGMVSVF
jgi:hypothetical protein